MAESAVSFLLEKLTALAVSEALLLAGVRQQIEDIKDELASMQAFLKDADRRQDTEEGVKEWVKQVRDAAYDLENVIDEFIIRFGRHYEHGFKDILRRTGNCIKHLPIRHNLAMEMQTLRKRINDISARKDRYSFKTPDESTYSDTTVAREVHFGEESGILGFEKDIESVIRQLINEKEAEGQISELTSVLMEGMGGSGKTTLARKVYNHSKVKEHFDCFAWVSVSQTFETNDLLKRLLKEFFKELREEMVIDQMEKMGKEEIKEKLFNRLEKMNTEELKEELFNHLRERKYMIMLDDVWSREAWTVLNVALPKNSKGSAIMITTRIADLSFALEADGLACFSHRLKPLPTKIAMELFSKKAFRNEPCPQELVELCNKIVDKCEGLPLAIVSLGGLMATKQKTEQAWKKAYDDLRWQLSSNPSLGRVKNILTLSYNALPPNLKPCFLYCSIFPEDFLIKRARLIKLWMAEGLVKEREGVRAEEVGEERLQELISRNMLQVVHTNFDGRVRTCSLHDLVRELAISLAKREEFFLTLESATQREVGKYRNLCVLPNERGKVSSSINMVHSKHLHSLLTFDANFDQPRFLRMLSSLKLIRILDLQGTKIKKLPSQVAELLLLKYLNLRGTWVKKFPRSFSKLVNLQTLDLRETVIGIFPKAILRMPNLRHLYLGEIYEVPTEVPVGLGKLGCLQTLVGIRGNKREIIRDMGNLTDLRKLEICRVKKDDMDELCVSVQKMSNLCRLFIESQETLELDALFSAPPTELRHLTLFGGLAKMPLGLGSLNNLSTLCLIGSRLKEGAFSFISSLRNLKKLVLIIAYEGRLLLCEEKGFPKLKFLLLMQLESLEKVILEEGSMPNLEVLGIHDCEKLERVPQGVHQLKNLQVLRIINMPRGFVEKLKKNGGEDHPLVQHVPKVELLLSDVDDVLHRLGSF